MRFLWFIFSLASPISPVKAAKRRFRDYDIAIKPDGPTIHGNKSLVYVSTNVKVLNNLKFLDNIDHDFLFGDQAVSMNINEEKGNT